MLISKKSVRKSSLFGSRFRDGSGTDFPVRQYLRCREDLFSGIIHAGLTVVFLLTLLAFTRSLGALFDHHGAGLSPWYRHFTLGLMVFFMLSVLRRLYYKVRDLWEIRGEMNRLQGEFRQDYPDSR